jgi:uncharacterized protein YbaR (Trm112 family)
MNLIYTITLAFCLNILIACNTSRKTMATTTAPKTEVKQEEPLASQDSVFHGKPKPEAHSILSGMSILTPASGQNVPAFVVPFEVVAPPQEKQLLAMQEKYQGITIETLRLGHELFNGTCTGCHEQKSIYSRTEESWYKIIDEMALIAEINEIEKDAVMKYVLSVKATQSR